MGSDINTIDAARQSRAEPAPAPRRERSSRMAVDNVNRRGFLRSAAALPAAGALETALSGQTCPAKEGTVRDRIWVFANPTNADYNFVRQRSVMSQLEAHVYMG